MPSTYLTPDVPLTDGDLVTPELQYLAYYTPVFDDQPQYLGHRAKILDSELSDAAGAIKERVATLTGRLAVSVFSGRTLAYTSGVVRQLDGSNLSIPAGQIVVPDNSTSFVFVGPTGTIQASTIMPVYRVPLARVTVVSGTVTLLEDLRTLSVYPILPVAGAIKAFGGAGQQDKTAVANEVFDQGVYTFRNFTVPAGVTVTVRAGSRFYCSGNVTINGTVNVETADPSVANALVGLTLNVSTTGGLNPGLGLPSIPYGFRTIGTAGGQGAALASVGANTSIWWGRPGNGGGNITIEASGTITIGTSGNIFADGTSGTQPHAPAVGPAPVYDPNAGWANTSAEGFVTGTGGGSGGQINLASLTGITIGTGATLSVRGGNGSNAIARLNSGTRFAGGGTGGSGGYIILSAPTVTSAGSNLLISGGNNGNPAGRDFTLTSANNWTLGAAFTASAPTSGGGYAGPAGFYGAPTSTTVVSNPGGQGQLIIQNIIPVF